MDVGTISLVLLLALIGLLAIGMPLGMASAFLAALTLIMKFEPQLLTAPWTFGDGMLTGRPGAGPLNILAQKIYGLLTDYVLISIPLFIFMASLLERSGIATSMYSALNVWLNRTRGGIAIVTSLMAVIMAAMSGIIGGEVVLLGLIALPQMLRLGYDQNLAIGTICASGSLGTMIPPSIVLIIYGLITETSIKALFTAAFVPGFVLAGCFIIYIIVRTRLNPKLAPLPEEFLTNALATLPARETARRAELEAELADLRSQPRGMEKFLLFLGFLCILIAGGAAALFVRAAWFVFSGSNAAATGDKAAFGTMDWLPWFGGAVVLALLAIFFLIGRDRTVTGWNMGKGLVPPIVVIGVVMGSIYGGITGITEAAGMGAFAVLVIAILRGEGSFELVWDSLMRTMKSTGTIIWVTIGAATLAGAYTIAGGPTYVANLIVSSEMPSVLVLLTMMLILLFMGAFMDWVGIVLLIIPVFLPIVLRLPREEIGLFGPFENDPRFIPIWFGILFCVNMQVSFLSPPFGPAAFYLKSVAPPHISLPDIFRGFLPFIGIQIFVLMIVFFFPEITMFFRE